MSYQAGVPTLYYYMIIITGQIRTIFQTVFGSRADEIYAMTNNQWGGTGTWVTPTSANLGSLTSLGIASYYDVPIDCFAVAPYVGLDGSTPTVNAWNNSNIQQMIDLWIHDMYYNTLGWSAAITSYDLLIAAYNATPASSNYNGTTGTCSLYGYEGGVSGSPGGVNNPNTLMIDLCNDPNWYVAEQDFYALLQRSGFANLNIYSYNIYYNGSNNWGAYHDPYQPYGKGDGSLASNGVAYANRNYFITPGFQIDYAATPATSFIANTASVRGQAFLEWMQPAQGKKGMLFVPHRFANQ